METYKHRRFLPTCVQLQLVIKCLKWSVWKSQDLRVNNEEICLGKIGRFSCHLSNSGNLIGACVLSCLRKNRWGRASIFPPSREGRETVCVWWFSCFQSPCSIVPTVLHSSTKTSGGVFSARWCHLFHVFEELPFVFLSLYTAVLLNIKYCSRGFLTLKITLLSLLFWQSR